MTALNCNAFRFVLLSTAVLIAAPLLPAQTSESTIVKQIQSLRSLAAEKRGAATIQIAQEVQTLPAGKNKLQDADALSHLVTEGDQGSDALQAVADTLAKALAEFPVPAKGDEPPMPYMDLARLVHYEHVNAKLDDPLFAKAMQVLEAKDADIQKADFTLKDLHNRKWTLSELRGKIVLVNFWATWCAPCRAEMPNLDVIYTHYQSQGLVILSITDEDAFKVNGFISAMSYHPPVLLDSGDTVHKLFHITGIPQSFAFDRNGKLVGVGIDECTQRQFFGLLAAAGLQPQ